MVKPALAIVTLALSAAAVFGSAPAVEPAEPPDPWAVLSTLREALAENGPMEVDFTQTFIPAGFASGDEERGHLYLALPDCLRWDYQVPYEKVYLLCGSQVHAWNPGEPSGRRHPVDTAEAPGLDLLRMRVERLAERYSAHLTEEDSGAVAVTLEPLEQVADITRATFELDTSRRRLVSLAYQDEEGSQMRFVFEDYRNLAEVEIFSPPSDVRWEEN